MSVENRDLRCYVTQAGFNQEALDKQLGRSTDLTHLVIDGTLLPDGSSPAVLVAVQDEARRYLLSRVEADDQNPSMLIAEAIIPADDGGFNINGIGIETSQGVLYAYARSTGDYKPLLESGQGSDLVLRVQFLPGNADQITLQVDPTAVLATVDFVVQRTQAATETVAGVVEKATTDEAKSGAADKFPDAAGVLAALRRFGLGVVSAESVSDLNELDATGFYNANNISTINIPVISSGTVLHVEGSHGPGRYATQFFIAYGSGVSVEKNGVYVRHKDEEAWESWHELFNSGGGLPGATETGAGVAEVATQAMVNGGTDDSAFITAKKLKGWVKQATESVFGLLKVATQAQTDAGNNDTVAVTPKKLRWGFAALMDPNGYIMFPTWMGGFVIQWLTVQHTAGKNVAQAFALPVAHQSATLMTTTLDFSSISSRPVIWSTSSFNATHVELHWTFGDITSGTTIRSAKIFAIGH